MSNAMFTLNQLRKILCVKTDYNMSLDISAVSSTSPPLLVPVLPRWNSQTLVHVTVKEAQDVPSYQETCKIRDMEKSRK